MTIAIHRNGDLRVCGATTIVSGQSTVYAESNLISVNGDVESHGGAPLVAATNAVYINGIMVVNVGDTAPPDSALHASTSASTGSSTIFVGNP